MMYTAHFRKFDKEHQEVKEHLISVSEYCKVYGKSIGIEKLSELVGLLHDIGKFSDEFQEYIKAAIEHEENGTRVLKCDDYLLEHHSNIIHDNDDETENNYRLLTQRWDSPIIFTTMVQFLDTIYASGTQALRKLHNLSDSVLIFDEIQAIPIKCISLFNSAINYLSRICNATVILCSATQPNLSETKIPLLKENNEEMFKTQEICDLCQHPVNRSRN